MVNEQKGGQKVYKNSCNYPAGSSIIRMIYIAAGLDQKDFVELKGYNNGWECN
jgi:hypothetical protein